MSKSKVVHLLHPDHLDAADVWPDDPLTICGYGTRDNVTDDPLAVTCRGECAGAALDALRRADRQVTS